MRRGLLRSRLLGVGFAAAMVASHLTLRGAEGEGAGTLFPDRWTNFVEPNFPFFSSVLDCRGLGAGFPTNNLTPRGLVLQLGNDCWACFDTDLLRVAAVWRGPAVSPVSMAQGSYHAATTKADAGEDVLPKPLGAVWLSCPACPGWQPGEAATTWDPRPAGVDPREVGRGPLPAALGRFKAVRLLDRGCSLEYEVLGANVREWIGSRLEDGAPVIERSVELDRVPEPLALVLGNLPGDAATSPEIRLTGPAGKLIHGVDHGVSVRLAPSDHPVRLRLTLGRGGALASWAPAAAHRTTARWLAAEQTRATLSHDPGAYVVDDIPPPDNNPWRRNVRLADIAFYSDGRAAAVTFDGDVWSITGLTGNLESVRWRRYASGFHEPLGLCVRRNELFVFDRNGIWRLKDVEGTGEADVHELFSNAFAQTAETREFATGIRPAPDGSFVIGKGGIQMSTLGRHNGTVLRVSADGRSSEILGYGLREPFIGVHPVTGLVTASDQQGHYVPSTPLHVIRDGQFYGFLSALLPKEQYPASIADPLTWIPYPVNPSGAGQEWLVGAKMGPLNGRMIHLGYNRPEIFVVLPDPRHPTRQAAVLSLTRDLPFAPLHGAVNPAEGMLYVAGFQIFGVTAPRVSGLARVRYTGAESTLPREVRPMAEGVLLRFDAPLAPGLATNPASYSAERWNYKRTFDYGSPHFKLDGTKGMEPMIPSSAYLSRDGKAVFVGIPDMRPVMQMRLGWSLAVASGASSERNAYFTPYQLDAFDPAAEGFDPLRVDLTPRAAAASDAPPSEAEGRRVAERLGCVLCHSNNGETLGKVGPSWKGLSGSRVPLADGSTATADDAYLRESIREPAAKVVKGYERGDLSMPSYEGLLSEAQVQSLILYIKTLR